jgi:DNA repair exonuclease SbcCD ATPase subunit
MEEALREGYSFKEACEELGQAPRDLWRLLKEYGDLIGYQDSEPEASPRFLSSRAVERARSILRHVSQGKTRQQIEERARFDELRQGAEAPPPGVYEMLIQKIEELESELSRSEEKRLEDRDKTLTTLARTQQELQRVKGEVAAASSRRERKRKSLWERIFGG